MFEHDSYVSSEEKAIVSSYDDNAASGKSAARQRVVDIASRHQNFTKKATEKTDTMKKSQPKIKENRKKAAKTSPAASTAPKQKAAQHGASSTSASDLQELQNAMLTFSFQGAENFNEVADNALKAFQDSLEISKDSLDAVLASGDYITHALDKGYAAFTQLTNALINENVEASKDFLKCRTFNDALTVQSNIVKHTVESCLEGFVRLNEIALQYGIQALKPLNEQGVAASKRLAS